MRLCEVQGCEQKHYCRGFCKTHYSRTLKRKPRVASKSGNGPRVRGTCSIDGCEKPHYGRGMCKMHWARWDTHGDPQTVQHGGTPSRHGHTANGITSPEYHSWNAMMGRCNNPSSKHYKYYGGRGIKVCERWYVFENFLADMGPRPIGHTLDRYPNKNGNYEPGNVRWATPLQQARNTRRTVMLTIDGVTRSMSEWAEIAGRRADTVYGRIQSGWDAKSAVFKEERIQERTRATPFPPGTDLSKCSVSSCDARVHNQTKLLCKKHYDRWWRNGDPSIIKKTGKVTHGHNSIKHRSREYQAWATMVQLCTNPNAKRYHVYGGAGVRICEEWRSFENFLRDMGARPEGFTLQRKDRNRDFEPGNCFWAVSLVAKKAA